jgi:hypothetical protein
MFVEDHKDIFIFQQDTKIHEPYGLPQRDLHLETCVTTQKYSLFLDFTYKAINFIQEIGTLLLLFNLVYHLEGT